MNSSSLWYHKPCTWPNTFHLLDASKYRHSRLGLITSPQLPQCADWKSEAANGFTEAGTANWTKGALRATMPYHPVSNPRPLSVQVSWSGVAATVVVIVRHSSFNPTLPLFTFRAECQCVQCSCSSCVLMELSFLQNFPIDFRSFGETMGSNWFNGAQRLGLDCDAVLMRTCIQLGFLRQWRSPELLTSSLSYLE